MPQNINSYNSIYPSGIFDEVYYVIVSFRNAELLAFVPPRNKAFQRYHSSLIIGLFFRIGLLDN